MFIIIPLTLLYISLRNIEIVHSKIDLPVLPYIITHNSYNAKYAVAKRKKRVRARNRIIKFEDVVTQKDISNINLVVLALMEFQKKHNNLFVPENYILKSEENENLKNFKLWKKLQEFKNEKSEKKKKYIYIVLKKMNFPLADLFSPEEIEDFEKGESEITTMSNLSTEENVHYDYDERQEVRKELFSPYIKSTKEKENENVKDFLASYKFIPKITQQNVLPRYSNKAIRKKGILKQILMNLKKDQIFNFNYNYYYDHIYNNMNDKDVDDYIDFIMKYKRTHGVEYDIFINRKLPLSNEINSKEKKFMLYTRKETEGAHSYDFDKWSFADFIEALVFFNDLYLDLNKERYEEFRTSQGNQKLDIIDFNVVDPSFVVPSDDTWPADWHGMPLGMYINQIRMGDIDGKFHFIRRKILDFLLFDFKSAEYEHKYLNFTWRKLYFGLAWFIHTRGHPIVIKPMDRIQFDTFSMDFCKPEEIQGLRLGFLIIQAQSHEKMFWNKFRDICLEINIRSADELIF
ncbi:fusion protein [Plasmodium gonderi]|uniref:Fusion protein n=1 Tax=Plasmodium gonderi TaxID=77519 RepID=A0A1Y1JHJ0_PLAGO|nr:fusion protein [Plasmodium gonderi]GAW80687.1 fusion protein [Plasmodium gonderi]